MIGRIAGGFRIPEPVEPYEAWRRVNGPNSRRTRRLDQAIDGLSRRGRFSVVTPVYNPPADALEAALASVVAQSYEHWELVVVDDASTAAHVRPLLRQWAGRDERIRVIEQSINGNISRATNAGAAAATGEFLVLFDHDDVLHSDCLAQLALAIGRAPDVDLLYSDHDKTDDEGRRFAPEFKPGWSPELLLSYCYAGHVKAIRTDLYHELGGLRVGFEGSQDHDLLLRASERARRVVHVPQLLYHWRVLPGSTAAGGHEKPASFEAGRRAVREAFQRRGVDCTVEIPPWAERAGSAVFRPVMPDQGPRVAIVVNAADDASTQRLLVSLRSSAYRNFRVVLFGSGDRRPVAGLDSWGFGVTTVEGSGIPLAERLNRLVNEIQEELILFLDGRAVIQGMTSLSQMVGWLGLEGVGAVGPRVLNRPGRVDHAGLAIDAEQGGARRLFEGLPGWDQGYLNLARVSRNVSALSACGLMTRRSDLVRLGGFDADAFPDDLFAVDYCLRLRLRGLRCVVSAESELVVTADQARRPAAPREIALFRERYSAFVDPYLNIHLDASSAELPIRPAVAPVGESARPLRILAATHNLNWEGAPLVQQELLAALVRMGKLSAVVVSPRDGPLRASYEDAGISVQIQPSWIDATDSVERLSSGTSALAELLVEGGFDVLHANTLQTFWAVLAARRAGVPSVWSVHESEPWRTYYDELPAQVASQALRSLAAPYRVVFCSQGSLDAWKSLDSSRNFVRVANPLDVQRFRARFEGLDRLAARRSFGIDGKQVCVLSLGTVCERKGQRGLLEAFRRLPADVAARTTCLVVGARDSLPYSRDLARAAEKLPIDRRDRFRVVPETGDTVPFWLAADMFCCTSRVESYPRVILEAMAAGLPLITTPVFGIAEQVRDQVNALFYQPGDHDGLARKLAELIRDDRRRCELAAESPWVLRGLPSHAWFVARYESLFRAAAESCVETDAVLAPLMA